MRIQLMMLLLLGFIAASTVLGAPPRPPATAKPQQLSPSGTVYTANGIHSWVQVVEAAGALQALQNPAARYVEFVPTDVAVTSFLTNMGLDLAALKARPRLAKELVAMHLVLAIPPKAQQQLAQGVFATVATIAAGQHSVLGVQKTAAGVVLTDGQGNKVNVLKVVGLQSNKTSVIVDRVLFSGNYYTSIASMCNHRQGAVSTMCSLLLEEGLLLSLSTQTFANTIFWPGNQAFTRAGIDPSNKQQLAREQLRDLLKYHVVKGVRTIPDGFQSGKSYDTLLPGQQLKIIYTTAGNGSREATVVPASGKGVPVVVQNVFIAQAVAHGISYLLQPAPVGSQTVAAESSSKSSSSTAASGRRLLAWSDIEKVIVPMNKAETDIRSTVRNQFKQQEERWS